MRTRLLTAVAAAVLLLSACGDDGSDDSDGAHDELRSQLHEGSPDEVVAAWAEIVGCTAPPQESDRFTHSPAVRNVTCPIPGDDRDLDHYEASLLLYDSPAGVEAEMNDQDCDWPDPIVVSEKWYSDVDTRDAANALLDAGGEEFCFGEAA